VLEQDSSAALSMSLKSLSVSLKSLSSLNSVGGEMGEMQFSGGHRREVEESEEWCSSGGDKGVHGDGSDERRPPGFELLVLAPCEKIAVVVFLGF
jgi:hypothetical protein